MINIFRVNDIVDLPVIESMSAQRLYTIRDVIIDMRESRVYALVCKERVFRRSLEAIPYRNISAITQNSVAVTGRTDQISLRVLSMKYRRFQSYKNILGKLVLNSRGETLGIIRDLIIDTSSGIIKAYELSEGYIDDILRGRHIIELECGHTLSDKNVVLKD
ncbi:MAG TPA: PRC-barrel domain-containing protein [Clostridia bacterium]|nr:PRC-barrel domain-containing protein [Clostridia bacterium]